MKKNIGNVDRMVRVLLALVIAMLYFTKQINGTPAIILGLIAGILLVTGFVGTCPLYMLFKLNTKSKVK
ncbi:MAG: DUF2892 domain-containing protein [Chitinophagales bacterium]